MTDATPIRVGFLGTGLMARYHLGVMLPRDDTMVVAVCEPSPAAFELAADEFTSRDLDVPPNEPDWRRFLERFAGTLDAVVVITPHAFHFEQATACLEAGLDVYLEKPMVMTAVEAEALIATRDRTGRLLVVGFQGSLSPQVREASRLIASGEIGGLLGISAVVWQDWDVNSAGTWRQDPELSGGGFLFDTGAHMLNTVCDLAGQDVAEVTAWLEHDGAAVDLRGVVMARLPDGALITMNGVGRGIPAFGSDVRVFCHRAIVRTGIWGERLEIQRAGSNRLSTLRSVRPRGVWDQFLAVRAGLQPNPSPPEVGLRMARLWDAIRESSARGGAVIRPALGGVAVGGAMVGGAVVGGAREGAVSA
jgi:predicted dehydrogenase